MKTSHIIILVIFAVGSAAALFFEGVFRGGPAVQDTAQHQIWEPRPAPDVTFTNMDSSKISLKALKGKIVILNFWATWCPPCVKEFPSMLEIMDEFKGQVTLVAVSHDENSANIRRFLDKLPGTSRAHLKSKSLYLAWDPDKKIAADHFHVLRLPETIIIDQESRMVRKLVGEINWTSPKMKAYFRSLSTGKPAEPLADRPN